MTRRPTWTHQLRPLGLLVSLAAGAWAGASEGGAPDVARAISVRATPVALAALEPGRGRVGALVFRGGLKLESPDERFGGWSALHVSADGEELTAISDEGHWMTARLRYGAQGWLIGLDGATLGPLLRVNGTPLPEKVDQDAESLAVTADGGRLVGFEREHRIWAYPGPRPFESRPQPFATPPGLERAPANLGLESLAALPNGELFALSEELLDAKGRLTGWLWRGGRWASLSYRQDGALRPSDATTLPDGDVLVLERSYSALDGLEIRLRRIAASCLAPAALLDPPLLAELKAPLSVDNYEGLSARRGPDGKTLLYMISDDNFSRLQKTYLMLFEVEPDESPKNCDE